MRRFVTLLSVCLLLVGLPAFVQAQAGILDPADPVVTYDPSRPPTIPAYGTMAKWVRTKRVSFATETFKAYYYKGLQFRLKFPKSYQHGVADGKKYPVYIFFHGIGERGTIYDNEYQLYHGGDTHRKAVDNGTFDGFLLYAQSSNDNGGWSQWQYDAIAEIVQKYLVPQVKADIDRVIINGLSGGGSATWQMTRSYFKLAATSLPISAPVNVPTTTASIPDLKYTPIWTFQGGKDDGPTPFTTESVVNAYKNAGANMNYTLYPDLGHNCWNKAWAEPGYFPFLNKAHKANPWPLNGRTEFCPGETINQVIGLTPGFTSYEWRKDGVLIPGANGNEITATAYGSYSARILRDTVWSDWSPVPVVIKEKEPTIPPAITITGMMSRAIPSVDGSTSVPLEVPAGYASYEWQLVGNSTVLGTSRNFEATAPGSYTVKVMEQYGCSSDFSAPVKIIDANGTNKPDAAAGLSATALSKTSVRLNWVDNPSPAYNETNYEIFESKSPDGPFKLVALADANASSYTINGLEANTTYYYKIRAVNESAASAATDAVSVLTMKDVQAPTAPGNLHVTGTTKTSVALAWDASSDDVSVKLYQVYVDGVMSYTTSQTTFTVYNLNYNQSYNFVVKAKDQAGNISQSSNQVTGQPVMNGLVYKQYVYTGTWTKMADFNTLEPVATGTMYNVFITPRTQEDRFAFLYEGYIRIPVDGTYTFNTNSDDGSKLWLGSRNGTSSPYSFTGAAIVDNDGGHSAKTVTSAALTLTAGVYPIAIGYFDGTSGQSLTVNWKTPQTNGSFTALPDSIFYDVKAVNGPIPTKPANLTATAVSHKQINLTWTDNSSNENAFEVWRTSDPAVASTMVGRTPANTTSFSDTTLAANTTYYYQVRATGHYGESEFSDNGYGVKYEYYEQSGLSVVPSFETLTVRKTGFIPGFMLGQQDREDNYAFKFSGTIKIPVAGKYTFYTTSDDGSNLYIDGFTSTNRVVNNDGVHTSREKSGTITLTAGTHTIYVSYFNKSTTNAFDVKWQGPNGSNIPKQNIPLTSLGTVMPNAKTLAMPGLPLAPSSLTATGATFSSVALNWQDNSSNEAGFEIARSIGNNTDYTPYKAVPANTTSFIDSALVPNGVYYYKVRAVNDGGNSSYSNSDSAITVNRLPQVNAIESQSMRYGTQLNINVSATDADGGILSLSASGLPAFASFTQTPGTNTGIISFNTPAITDQGTYPVTIIAADAFGGNGSTSFNLVVSDNFSPVLAAVDNVTLSESQTSSISLSATDQNAADVMTWSFTGLPSFATVNATGATASISLAPGYADNGLYNVTAKVDDGKGGFDTKSFTITVTDVNPNYKVYVNFTSSTYQAPAPWNNTNKAPAAGDIFAGLKNDAGVTTGVSLQLMNVWQGLNTTGANTGNNSGIYPDNVLRTSYYTNTTVQNVKVSGLSPANKYNFTFLGSRYNPSGGVVTVYSIGSQSVSLNAANNYLNTVSINQVSPAADSTITFTVAKEAGSTYGYLNSVVIEAVYDDGSAPAKPRDLAGSFVNGKAHLTWTDAAFNESAYEVYRSATRNGAYTLLNPGGNNANLVSYDDATVTGNKTFYYAVRALNANGISAFSDTVSVTTPNTSPLLDAVSNQQVNTGQTVSLNVSATDDAGDVITLSLANAPVFVTLNQTGNGTGVISIQPGNTTGVFKDIKLTATDQSGASSSKLFTVTVVDTSLTYAYVNFNLTYPVAGWNNFSRTPDAGASLADLKTSNNASTGITVTLTDGWVGSSTGGTLTGSNSGVYADDVMRTSYYDPATSGKRILLSGLSTDKKYNLIFTASRASTGTLITRYAAGGKSGDLNVDNNTTGFVKLSDLSADANGQIEIVVSKVGSTSNAYIGALEIQSYPFLPIALPPTNVTATGLSTDKIRLNWNNAGSAGTGYELWRSTSANGVYSKIADMALNSVTYTNTGLTGGSVYYYKIRTVISAGQYTAFSNIASASTVSYIVNLNLNDAAANAESGGWNNTNTLLSDDFTMSNLINSVNQSTGINFNVVENFSGFNNALGLTTGNNSGVVPDKVMSNFYFMDFADTARVKFTGLNQASAYNFIFYAGSSYNQANNTVYKIGDQTVSLNSFENYSNTGKISNIRPDENGEVWITVYSSVGYGFINSISLEAIPNVEPVTQQTQQITGRSGPTAPQIAAAATTLAATAEAAPKQEVSTVEDETLIKAYPNPFVSDLTLQLSLKEDVSRLTVIVYDMSGKVVFRKEFTNALKGVWRQQLGLNGKITGRGNYILQVVGADQKPRVTKVVKY
ncbi:MAG: fibronectin type III domain-containing protein [Chitinophagaceae bacterium]